MAQVREVVPVMDEKTSTKAKGTRATTKTTAGPRKGLGGEYGASFTGEGTAA